MIVYMYIVRNIWKLSENLANEKGNRESQEILGENLKTSFLITFCFYQNIKYEYTGKFPKCYDRCSCTYKEVLIYYWIYQGVVIYRVIRLGCQKSITL